MDKVNCEMISERIHELDVAILTTQSLLQANLDVDTALTMMDKFKFDSRKQKEALAITLTALRNQRNKLIGGLKDIAIIFNDLEEEVFVMAVIENHSSKYIADKINKTDDYTRHLISKIKRTIENDYNDNEYE